MSDLEDLPPLRDVIAAHDLRAKKALGQNFLLDQNITNKIARAAGDLKGMTVFEIGPGPGGLTRSLLKMTASHVIAVEFDPRAVSALQDLKDISEERLDIVQADALETNLLELACDKPCAIIANLPYNIATPLLIGWLQQIRENKNAYASMTLMFQKEVAQRLIAKPKTKAYGRLSVMAQWLCGVKILFDLPPSAFTPPPKVTSSIVQLVPKELSDDAPSFEAVESITKSAFAQRRKMLRSSLKDHMKSMEELEIDPQKRAEELEIKDFISLAQEVLKAS